LNSNKLDPEKLNRLLEDTSGKSNPAEPESMEMLQLAARLQEIPKPSPSTTAENECVHRLRSKLNRQRSPRRAPARFRLIWVASALLMVSLATFAALHLSKDSLPGDALYTVKRVKEKVYLVLERDAVDRSALRVRFADSRLKEYVACVGSGRRCEKVLADMVNQSEAALNELEKSGVSDSLSLARVGMACAYQAETLRGILVEVQDADTTRVIEIIGACDMMFSECCRGGACGGCMKEPPCKKNRNVD